MFRGQEVTSNVTAHSENKKPILKNATEETELHIREKTYGET